MYKPKPAELYRVTLTLRNGERWVEIHYSHCAPAYGIHDRVARYYLGQIGY
jgi:hypothetical protein